MKYYKLINGSEFIGIGTTLEFRRFQKKHSILLACDESQAQYIQIGESLFRDDWMCPVTTEMLFAQSTTISEITEDEYNILLDAVESGQDVPIEPETPDTNVEEPDNGIDNDTEVTIEYVKSMKVSEMSRTCNQVITHGIDCELSDGKTYHFSLTTQDQLNLITLSTMVATGKTEIPYHADGELCRFYSVDDINIILNAATAYTTYHESYFNALRAYINSMDDIEEISKVTYGVSIPEQYMSDVLKALMIQ